MPAREQFNWIEEESKFVDPSISFDDQPIMLIQSYGC